MTEDGRRYEHVVCVTCGERYQRIDFRGNPHATYCANPKEGNMKNPRITVTASARWLLNNDDNNAAPLIERHNKQLADAPAGSSVLTVQRFDHNGRLLWCITNADRSETIVCTPGDRDKSDWAKPSPAWEGIDTSQPYTEPDISSG